MIGTDRTVEQDREPLLHHLSQFPTVMLLSLMPSAVPTEKCDMQCIGSLCQCVYLLIPDSDVSDYDTPKAEHGMMLLKVFGSDEKNSLQSKREQDEEQMTIDRHPAAFRHFFCPLLCILLGAERSAAESILYHGNGTSFVFHVTEFFLK
ncbi:hypothetical protein DNTS_035432 [Danionella cerebrum]|uniref:Uncharacterized protein n=1 Tax=Danionella cerebrum TaxID=2873325 RepID=A0A553MM27_9TELE|nr:hypothetical protein DNTS_035432 [Danionella translucida]